MPAAKNGDPVSARELAKAANVPYNTIDYWSERDLLVYDISKRQRWYDRKRNVRRVTLIRQLQNRGYSIKAILDEIKRREF